MDKKWIIIIAILVLIWVSFFCYLIIYGEKVSKDPCSVCAERLGKEVVCNYGKFNSNSVTFFPNGSIKQ